LFYVYHRSRQQCFNESDSLAFSGYDSRFTSFTWTSSLFVAFTIEALFPIGAAKPTLNIPKLTRFIIATYRVDSTHSLVTYSRIIPFHRYWR
jgi:hypothetical protein